MKAFALYAVATIAIVALLGWLLTLGFSGPRDVSAIGLSAVVVVVVQLAAFGVTRLLSPRGVIAAWGAGALLRFLTLAIYALLVVKVLGMPAAAALLSMAVFFFLSTLIEPLLLKL
jgi:hypothetical protein